MSAETRAKARNIPWQLMGDMRHNIAHEYFQVNLKITLSTVQNNLPKVVAPLEDLLDSFRES